MSTANTTPKHTTANSSIPEVQKKVIKTIRTDPERVKAILNQLDQQYEQSKQKNSTRESYHYRKGAVLTLNAGFDTVTPFVIVTNRITPTHISFLFGGFVHPDTACNIRLTTMYGAWNDNQAVIEKCEYIDENIHHATARFAEPIDSCIYSAEAVHPRVLLVEDDKLFAQIARKFLGALNAVIDHAKNGQEAVEMAMNNIYDLVLMDMEMPVMDGYAATTQLREHGYIGTVVATTSMTQPQDKERCLSAGCDIYIPKPYSQEDIVQLFESLQGEPVFSEFESDSSMHEIIGMFIVELPGRVRAIEEALMSENVETTTAALRSLKAVAGACGFNIITQRAAEIESKLIANTPVDQTKSDIIKLIKTCFKARSSARAMQTVNPQTSDNQQQNKTAPSQTPAAP